MRTKSEARWNAGCWEEYWKNISIVYFHIFRRLNRSFIIKIILIETACLLKKGFYSCKDISIVCPYEFVETGLVTVTVKRCSTLNDACLAGCIHSLSLDRMPVKNRFVSVFRLTRRATVTWLHVGERTGNEVSRFFPSLRYIYTHVYTYLQWSVSVYRANWKEFA